MNKFTRTALVTGILGLGLTFAACEEYSNGGGTPTAPSSSSNADDTADTPDITVGTGGEQAGYALAYPFPFDAADWQRPPMGGGYSLESTEGALARQLGQPVSGEGYAVMRTNMGDVYLRLFPQYAPLAVENFVTHARNGYFDGLVFHRVIEDFMVQGGDPQGTGMGGESIWGQSFGNEFTTNLQHIRGALSMANSDNPQIGRTQTNGSQFFIVQNSGLHPQTAGQFQQILENHMDDFYPGLEEQGIRFRDIYPEDFINHFLEFGGTPHLDFAHTVFGQVFRGMDVVDAMGAAPVGANDRPVEDIVIETIEIRVWQ
ncbi:MAG: peptidylprolyl isomerase [Defluviitaleaceae bacterium]|nr:peptidylprolyl isomerase [Defluviitaleaceae bacterium]